MTTTTADDTFATRARLAWFFLLGGFVIFSAMCLSVPFITNAILQNSSQSLQLSLSATSEPSPLTKKPMAV